MRITLYFALASIMTACASTHQPAATTRPEEGIMLVVENVTAVPVAVYVADAKMHTRLGMVEANAQKSLLVRQTLLGTRTSFRVYAFRGIEACPVARVIDIRYSRTPRITVTASDTVVSAYISGDACGHKAGGP